MLLKRRLFAAEKLFHPSKKPQTETIAIAFLDTGISPVADFTQPKNRIVCFLDLVNGRTRPYDDNGHGTHMPVRNCENNIRISSERSLPVPFFRSFPQLLHSR